MNSRNLITQLNENPKLREAYFRQRASESFYAFVRYVKPKYEAKWFHKEICEAVDRLLNNPNAKNLMLSMPPRHGKTELISRCLPAYCFGRWPDGSIISTSYAADLASRNNRDVQRIIDSNRYRDVFPETALFGKNIRSVAHGAYLRNSDIFEIVGKEGTYRSAGVGGGITGMGFSILGVIDDPVKNREEAESRTVQESVLEWYRSTFKSRKEDSAKVILIMTRWHKRDLAGRILEEEGDEWDVINFPAIYESDYPRPFLRDPRKSGEALWPEKYGIKFLNQFKRNKYNWYSLYQQLPYIKGGNLINREWIPKINREQLPDLTNGQLIRFWDLAGTPKEAAKQNDPDYTTGALVFYCDSYYYVLDIIAKRDTPSKIEALMLDTAAQDELMYGRVVQVWEEEGGASGKFITDYFNGLFRKYLRRPYRTNKSKEWYFDQLANKAETGNLVFVDGVWIDDRLIDDQQQGQTLSSSAELEVTTLGVSIYDELEEIPKASHDDRADALAKAVYLLSEFDNVAEEDASAHESQMSALTEQVDSLIYE